MESFFARVEPFWPAGRRDLHWHVLPTLDEAVALAAPYAGITGPGLEPVSPDGMHCTLLHAIGAARDDVDIESLLRDVRRTARSLVPVTLTFDRPAVGALAIEVSGWPGAPFSALVDMVTAATDRTGAAFKPGRSRYPHISLGYTTSGAASLDVVALRADLASIDGPLSVTVLADRIHLERVSLVDWPVDRVCLFGW
ncbi:2'-5' RNA ligase family protein [Streptomyces sp. NPDC017520]|uniref:2'-5' RNA ligase family protein n=1 Tax=Streptomyces sp. NPDC017520 TaxID=3364998 RepID=UPI0037AA7243